MRCSPQPTVLLLGLIMVALLSCGRREGAHGPWTTSVDTLNGGAGPIVVVNTPPAGLDDQDVSWRFEEIYRIADSAFASIAQIAVDSHDRLATVDYTTQELRV